MAQTSTKTIGNINGKWQFLFKALLAVNALMIAPLITWCIWATTTLIDLKYNATDRFTGAMFIEVQDSLAKKNPGNSWLDARDVREIQRNNAPYAK